MTRKWLHIAKAEFLVQTARFRGKRRVVLPAVLVFSIVWAVYLVPMVMSKLITGLGSQVELLLVASLPGFMRSIVFLIWIYLLITPLSQSLQEIKVSQWEVMLSHNVSTRDIMVGTFIARVPVYGLLVLFLAPLVVSPFVTIYQVSVTGQLIMYLTLFFVSLGVLWLGNLLSTAIQAKLGESPRGNDIAKALVYAIWIIFVVPVYLLMFYSTQLSQAMGTDITLFFPFTWGADLVTWTIVSFKGTGLSESIVAFFESNYLKLSGTLDLLFLSIFTLGTVGLALLSADRIFRIIGGARTEKITTVGKDGIFVRGIKRYAQGSFGIRLVTVVKDFTRKVQNVSAMVLGVILSVLAPLMVGSSIGASLDPEKAFFLVALQEGIFMGMISGITFGGIGFLDSQDQLWIIISAPNGAAKFVKARVAEGLLLALFFSVAPPVILTITMGLSIAEMFSLLALAYISVCGGMLIGTGVTAHNPNYDDTKSKAFTINQLVAMAIYLVTFIAMIFAVSKLGLATTVTLTPLLGVPVLLVGLIVVYVGARRLGRQL